LNPHYITNDNRETEGGYASQLTCTGWYKILYIHFKIRKKHIHIVKIILKSLLLTSNSITKQEWNVYILRNFVQMRSLRIYIAVSFWCPFTRDTNKFVRFFCLLTSKIRNIEQHTCLLLTNVIMNSGLYYISFLWIITRNVKNSWNATYRY
jgi:hypothetical protein